MRVIRCDRCGKELKYNTLYSAGFFKACNGKYDVEVDLCEDCYEATIKYVAGRRDHETSRG